MNLIKFDCIYCENIKKVIKKVRVIYLCLVLIIYSTVKMITEKEQKLIIKYFTESASFSEMDELEFWLREPDNEKKFNNYVKINYLINYNLKNFDANKTKRSLDKLIQKEKEIVRIGKIKRIMKYAAILIVAITSSYFFLVKSDKNLVINNNEQIVNTKIEPGTNKAILTLGDGSEVNLEKGALIQTQNAKSDGAEIIYEPKKSKTQKLEYNSLTVPRGGQYYVELSDGTKVWMNSESKLKYPVNFIKGRARKVELVYGEAYFDVSPSTNHDGSEFKVYNNKQEICVLGTEFNIKAYKDESNIYTTLVEGKVVVKYEDIKQELKPSQQSNIDIKGNVLMLSTVDVYNEISWKEGVFSFEKKPFKEVMNVLSRWFDMEVVFENKEIEDILFDGVLGKEQNIDDILAIVQDFGIISNYKIINKKVVLK